MAIDAMSTILLGTLGPPRMTTLTSIEDPLRTLLRSISLRLGRMISAVLINSQSSRPSPCAKGSSQQRTQSFSGSPTETTLAINRFFPPEALKFQGSLTLKTTGCPTLGPLFTERPDIDHLYLCRHFRIVFDSTIRFSFAPVHWSKPKSHRIIDDPEFDTYFGLHRQCKHAMCLRCRFVVITGEVGSAWSSASMNAERRPV